MRIIRDAEHFITVILKREPKRRIQEQPTFRINDGRREVAVMMESKDSMGRPQRIISHWIPAE